MPFLNQIVSYINDFLKGGSLNKEKLQPATFYGLSTIVARSTTGSKDPNQVEPLPAIIDAKGKIELITADSKMSLQIYHKLVNKTYSYEKKSFGDDYVIRSTSEMNLVAITNSKISGKTQDVLEPVIIFGMPQRLSTALTADLGINNSLIAPLSSNMDSMGVFRQEFPKSNLFLTEQMSMFLIRYKIELLFTQACIEKCLCE